MLGATQTKGQPITLNFFGTYRDKLVKTRDGWRFKERVLLPEPPKS